jgi:uncharacterized protein YciI
MAHFLLIYDFTDDYFERRGQFRAEHLAYAWAASERGELLAGGALADPVDQGMLLFEADSPDTPESFARDDPYVTNAIVIGWRVRPWTTVVGTLAATPVRP